MTLSALATVYHAIRDREDSPSLRRVRDEFAYRLRFSPPIEISGFVYSYSRANGDIVRRKVARTQAKKKAPSLMASGCREVKDPTVAYSGVLGWHEWNSFGIAT